MAPVLSTLTDLAKRQYYGYCNGYGYYYGNSGCYYNGWYAWGRWLLLGLVILAAILFFLFFSCCSARRRRRAGARPYPLTGWAAPPSYGQATNNSGYYNQSHTVPQQEQNVYGQAPGSNNGYFGGQTNGANYQQPYQKN